MFGMRKESSYPLCGLAAMMLVLPFIEVIMYNTDHLYRFHILLLLCGALIGMVFSFSFSFVEWLNAPSSKLISAHFFISLILAGIGGLCGFLVGQIVMSFLLNHLNGMDSWMRSCAVCAGYMISWGILGLFIGFSEGRGRLSGLLAGAGGGMGGLIGGAIFFLLSAHVNEIFLRIAGFAVMGIVIGYAISFIKKYFSLFELVVLNGTLAGKEYLCLDTETKVGRNKACSLLLNGYDGVSREHCMVVNEKGSYRIKDLASTNGTYVNETRVDTAVLNDGDIIMVGAARMITRIRRR